MELGLGLLLLLLINDENEIQRSVLGKRSVHLVIKDLKKEKKKKLIILLFR
jgi:hypothetical protein